MRNSFPPFKSDEPQIRLMESKLRLAAALGVAARIHMGQDRETIRRGVVGVAVDAIGEYARDDYELELHVATVQRAVEEELDKAGL